MSTIKELLAKKKLIVCPCAYDALSALMIEKAGFDIVYISGLGVAASDVGMPDLGLLTASEVIRRAAVIVQSVSVPVICDANTGYGDAKNVWRTIRQFEAAGISGAQMEDQTLVKRCGYLAGKEVISAEDYMKKLRAAVDARKGKDFVIVARTDCKESSGMDEVVRRLNLYADNGADLAMSVALHTFDEYKRLTKEVKIPIVAVAPSDPAASTVKQWEETGVKIVIYFGLPLFTAMKAATKALRMLRTEGSVEKMREEFFTYDEYADVVELPRWLKLAEKY